MKTASTRDTGLFHRVKVSLRELGKELDRCSPALVELIRAATDGSPSSDERRIVSDRERDMAMLLLHEIVMYWITDTSCTGETGTELCAVPHRF